MFTYIINVKVRFNVSFSRTNYSTYHHDTLHIFCPGYRKGYKVLFAPKERAVRASQANTCNYIFKKSEKFIWFNLMSGFYLKANYIHRIDMVYLFIYSLDNLRLIKHSIEYNRQIKPFTGFQNQEWSTWVACKFIVNKFYSYL